MISPDQLLARLAQKKELLGMLCEDCGIDPDEDISPDLVPAILEELDNRRRQLVKMHEKGGVVIVVPEEATDDETLVTAYKRNSYRRPK